ncbi:MAG: hypothetical protein V8R07_00035 [Bacteroides fragilis]
MGFPEVVACCADTVVIVRDTDFSFGGYHSFSRKEIHNPASGNGFNLVWQQVAQAWFTDCPIRPVLSP